MKNIITTALLASAIGLSGLTSALCNADTALNSNINTAILGNIGTIDKDLLDQTLVTPPIDTTSLFPDITVSNLTVTGEASPTPNRPEYKNVPVSFVVHNIGNVAVTRHFDVIAYIHGNTGLRKYMISLTLDNPNLIDQGIPSGGSVHVSGTLRVADRDFFSDQFFVRADDCGAREFTPKHCDIKELSEENNRSNTARL